MTNKAVLTPPLSSETSELAEQLAQEFPESTPHRIARAMSIARESGADDEIDFLGAARRYLLQPTQ